MLNKINDWITGFVPESVQADEDGTRAYRFFIVSSFITAGFALGYCFMSMYLHGAYFAIAMIISVMLFCLLPVLLRFGFSYLVIVNVYPAIIGVIYILLVYWGGGIRTSDVTPWIILLPAAAITMQGFKATVIWLLIALGIVAGFSYFNFKHLQFNILFDVSKDPVFHFLSITGLLCIVSLVIFVSENSKRQALKKLREQNQALDNLNQEKNRFLAVVAHDLKNPLAVVRSFAKVSANPNTSATEKETYLQYIATSTDRMFELIKNLLNVSMIESGQIELNTAKVNLENLINACVAEIELLAKTKQIEIATSFPGHLVQLKTDKSRVEQILDNYLSNALKYAPAGTTVLIKLTDKFAFTEISVIDHGPGIALAEQAKLFKPYSTTSSVPREGESKTGLGLANVKKIADALGCEVGYRDEDQGGSEFYLRFEHIGA
jgi:signal transduction histidine kinase